MISKSRKLPFPSTTAPLARSDIFAIIALPTRFLLCHLRLSHHMICGHVDKSPMTCVLPLSFPAAADDWENSECCVVCCHIIHRPFMVYNSSPKTLARSQGSCSWAFCRRLGLSCLCFIVKLGFLKRFNFSFMTRSKSVP